MLLIYFMWITDYQCETKNSGCGWIFSETGGGGSRAALRPPVSPVLVGAKPPEAPEF